MSVILQFLLILIIIIIVVCLLVFFINGMTDGFSNTTFRLLTYLNLINKHVILTDNEYFYVYGIFFGLKFKDNIYRTEKSAIEHIKYVQEEKLKKRLKDIKIIGEYSSYDLVDDSLKKQLIGATLKDKLK